MTLSNLKTYTGHYLTYALGGIVTLLTIAHAYGLAVPKYGPAIVAGSAVLLGAIDQVRKIAQANQALPSPAPAAVNKQGGEAYPALLALLVTLAVCGLVACSTLQKATTNPVSASAIEAAIDLGVGTYIQQTAKTPADQAAKAAQISAIASAVEGALTGDQATLAALDQVLRAKIAAAHLPPADQAAALILTQMIQSIVLQEIQGTAGQTPPLSADQVVAVKVVLDDVIQAASFYGVHARAVVRAELAP